MLFQPLVDQNLRIVQLHGILRMRGAVEFMLSSKAHSFLCLIPLFGEIVQIERTMNFPQ